MSQNTKCRWGILGTAGIAKKNWHAIKMAPEAELRAVASRSHASAQTFIDDCQSELPHSPAPEPVEGYDALLARDDIDAVYIPLPTGIRKEWVIKAAQAGKHVLAEKPAAISSSDLEEMLDACRQNNVQYMDGVMFMHSARLTSMGDYLRDGESVGDLKRLASHHAFAGDQAFLDTNIRLNSDLEPQGALGDLGWYSIRMILWAMNWEMPTRVYGRTLEPFHRSDSPNPVPIQFSGELIFKDVSASLYCSFVTENQQWTVFGGSKGFLHIKDFVLPFVGNELSFTINRAAFHVDNCQFNMERHTSQVNVAEYANNSPCAQESKMMRKFSSIALSNSLEPQWGQIALKTQQVMDALLQSAADEGSAVTLGDSS